MDDVSDLSEMLGSESDSEDLRPPASADLRRFKVFSFGQVQDILNRYAEFAASHEMTTMPPEKFAEHFCARRDSWFVEVVDAGVLFFTEVVPGFSAEFHVVFWDRKLGSDRLDLVRTTLRTAFERFDLRRVLAVVPVTNRLLEEKLRKVGFIAQGQLRLGWQGLVDATILDILPKDLPWTVNPMPSSSLD
jgi:hypothetical protein